MWILRYVRSYVGVPISQLYWLYFAVIQRAVGIVLILINNHSADFENADICGKGGFTRFASRQPFFTMSGVALRAGPPIGGPFCLFSDNNLRSLI